MTPGRIAIIGNTPPPVGGVSVHVARFLERLREEHPGRDVVHIKTADFVRRWGRLTAPALLARLLASRASLCHLHKPDHVVGVWYALLILRVLGRHVVLTLHNENLADQLADGSMGPFKRFSLRLVFRRLSHIVCVNERTARALVAEALPEARVSVIPAFIPQSTLDRNTPPKPVRDFVSAHSPVLAGYSHRIYLYNGHDRYGGDMMLEAVRRLAPDLPNVGLVLVMPNPGGETARGIEGYRRFIAEHSIGDHVLIHEEPLDLPALFAAVDIHIRPSNTDGDPVAVRESLHLGVPTIASDCTFKPRGTRFHKDRDQDDLEHQIRTVLGDLDGERKRLQAIEQPDFAQALLDVYAALER